MKRFVILIVGLVAVCFSAEAQLTNQQQIQKLNFVYQQIRNNYVDDVPLDHLVEEAITATLHELDPHSRYLSRDEMATLRTRLRGEFAGVGIRYIMHNDTLVVRGIIDHSPAHRSNIHINDRITAIDGRNIVGISTDSAAAMLRGKAGSKLSLTIARRNEDNTLKVNVQRDDIESSAISTSFCIGNVGYIAISKFSKPLASEFLAAYKTLGDIGSLILDLRDNSGGAITSAIDLTSLFLHKGDVIVSTEGRINNIVYDTKRDGVLRDIPLTVIINENSASASEIFAGAIQDHDRGTIIGRTSYGKGLVQRVIDLKDGTGVCLTVARYKTPSGRVIQRPYAMGDAEAYARDTLRYMHPDSVPLDHELLYHTLRLGRKVYGGGGITPDVYIEVESNSVHQFTRVLLENSLSQSVVIELFDRITAKELLSFYPTIEVYNEQFELDQTSIDYMISLVGEISPIALNDGEGLKESMRIIKAHIANDIYGNGAYYSTFGRYYDKALEEALSIISTQEQMDTILCR